MTHHQPKPRRDPRDDGCVCASGPVIAATWRGPFSTLTVALEHRDYCPIPPVLMDVDAYATTGERIPLPANSTQLP